MPMVKLEGGPDSPKGRSPPDRFEPPPWRYKYYIMVRSCCILAPDGRFQCAYPKCPKLYASQDAVRKHCRLQHLEWLRNLQTTTAKAPPPVRRDIESPRLTALKCLPASEALELLQADDWLQDLMDFSGALPAAASADVAAPELKKESSVDEHLDDEIIEQCIKSLNTAIRRCPSAEQQVEMQKVVRLLSMKAPQIAQLGPREQKKVLTIRKSSIQKMQLANEIRKTKAAEMAAEKLQAAEGGAAAAAHGQRGGAPPTGRSPSLRPRAGLDGKGRMPPASYFPPSKAQKTDSGSSPDI
ncbi:hypothetical protein AB1Y20_022707 [Prymnesium parvum]|uniref:C2H2-type domain-containing protein n=1 Tax=Prymnesium parvum TaxID=97485 RepID=A0AB34JKD4_PRYPA